MYPIVCEAHIFQIFLNCRIIIITPVPVLLHMNKKDFFRPDPPCQSNRLFKGIQGLPRYVVRGIFETVFEVIFKYTGLNYQKIGPLVLGIGEQCAAAATTRSGSYMAT